MKTLENKQTEIKISEEKKATYADLIKIVLDIPPHGGYKVSEMKQRFKIVDILDSGKLEFEDSDADHLKKLVSEMTWSNRHKDLIQFVEDVVNNF